MVSLVQLWLPILLGGVGMFVASSIIHMALQFWHNPDYHQLSNEDEVRAAMRKGNAAPGMYLVPYCKPEDMKKQEFKDKFIQGPVGFMILRPSGLYNMGKSLGQWFAFCVLVSLFAGYVAASTLAAGTASLQVLRVVSTTAFMGCAFGAFPQSIWWGQPWRATFKDVVDGLVYGLIIGAVFCSLWPH